MHIPHHFQDIRGSKCPKCWILFQVRFWLGFLFRFLMKFFLLVFSNRFDIGFMVSEIKGVLITNTQNNIFFYCKSDLYAVLFPLNYFEKFLSVVLQQICCSSWNIQFKKYPLNNLLLLNCSKWSYVCSEVLFSLF